MVKGCKRSMIVLRDTGSAVFDEAYFLLKEEGHVPLPEQDALIREANRIVRERSVAGDGNMRGRGARRLETVLWFASGLLCGVGLTFLMTALI